MGDGMRSPGMGAVPELGAGRARSPGKTVRGWPEGCRPPPPLGELSG